MASAHRNTLTALKELVLQAMVRCRTGLLLALLAEAVVGVPMMQPLCFKSKAGPFCTAYMISIKVQVFGLRYSKSISF